MSKNYTGFTSHHNVKRIEIIRQSSLVSEGFSEFTRAKIVIHCGIGNTDDEIYSEITLFGGEDRGEIEIEFKEEPSR